MPAAETAEKHHKENLHPVLPNHIYLQIQEDREYILLWEGFSNVNLSDTINTLHQGGHEIEHTTRNSFGRFFLIFRKIPRPEESEPRRARHSQTDLPGQTRTDHRRS